MSHGGKLETSLMLHCYPDLVDEDRIEDWAERDMPFRHAAEDMVEGGAINVYRSSDAYSGSGAEGDPSLASADKGAAIFDRLAEELERLFQDVHRSAV